MPLPYRITCLYPQYKSCNLFRLCVLTDVVLRVLSRNAVETEYLVVEHQ